MEFNDFWISPIANRTIGESIRSDVVSRGLRYRDAKPPGDRSDSTSIHQDRHFKKHLAEAKVLAVKLPLEKKKRTAKSTL